MMDAVERFRDDEGGTATVEFVLVFPVFIYIFVAMFESSMIMTRQVLLERSLDMTVRDLRINADGSEITSQQIRDEICATSIMLEDCADGLVLELTPIDTTTYNVPDADVPCVDRAQNVRPDPGWNQGVRDELMLIRVCYSSPQMLPISGVGMALTRDASGAVLMVASSIFVNEPR